VLCWTPAPSPSRDRLLRRDRQWCGRLGKVETAGPLFLTYVTARGYARWTDSYTCPGSGPRTAGAGRPPHVPPDVTFRRAADRPGPAGPLRGDVPFGWVAAMTSSAASAFRAELRGRNCATVLDVPANTLVRDLGKPPAPAGGLRRGGGVTSGEGAAGVAAGGGWPWARGQGAEAVRAVEAWVQARTRTAVSAPGTAGGHPERRGRAAGLVRALQRPRGDP